MCHTNLHDLAVDEGDIVTKFCKPTQDETLHNFIKLKTIIRLGSDFYTLNLSCVPAEYFKKVISKAY
jgi:hypothetical protein